MRTQNSSTFHAMDAGAVTRAKKRVAARLPQGRVEHVTDMFAAFSDPTRLRLLLALAEGELCVHDLSLVLGVSASAVSHQLRGLRALRLVRGRRDGKMTFYALDDEHVLSLLQVGMEHAREAQRAPSKPSIAATTHVIKTAANVVTAKRGRANA